MLAAGTRGEGAPDYVERERATTLESQTRKVKEVKRDVGVGEAGVASTGICALVVVDHTPAKYVDVIGGSSAAN